MKRLSLLLVLIIALVGCNGTDEPQAAAAQAEQNPGYGSAVPPDSAETVVTGIASPWGMAWLPGGAMLITDRKGQLRLYEDGQLAPQPLSGVPEVWARGQGGLLDIALHPDYEQNGWIYLTYSSPEGGEGANTALMRARLNDSRSGLTDQEVLYKATPNTSRGQHFGSRIAFTGGHVYFSVGDRGNRDENPQDITRDGGKIYRLNPDGSVPDDNPFVDEPNAKAAVYSYGHRNPQGMDVHPGTGEVWVHEHGPRGGDEVNRIEKGANYGWPVISFGINYDGTSFTDDTARAGMEQPEWYWDPSIAPSGMVFVTSDRYPAWQGDLLVGSLKFNYLVRLGLDGNTVTEQEIVFRDIGRVRNIRQGPDGYIYVATEGNGIKRILPE